MSDSWDSGLLCPWDSPGKNTRVDCHFLLRGSSWPRNQTWVSSILDRYFTNWATFIIYLIFFILYLYLFCLRLKKWAPNNAVKFLKTTQSTGGIVIIFLRVTHCPLPLAAFDEGGSHLALIYDGRDHFWLFNLKEVKDDKNPEKHHTFYTFTFCSA